MGGIASNSISYGITDPVILPASHVMADESFSSRTYCKYYVFNSTSTTENISFMLIALGH
jgi:hypothetical protein